MAGNDGRGFFHLGAAAGVFAAGDGVLDHGVGNDERDIGRNGRELEAEVAAVEQQGMIFGAVGGDELVHDAAIGADEFVFGALAETGEHGPRIARRRAAR